MHDITVLYLSKTNILPGTVFRPHVHDYWHFSFFLSGEYVQDGASSGPRCICTPANVLTPGKRAVTAIERINVMFLVHDQWLRQKLAAFPFSEVSAEGPHLSVLLNIVEQVQTLSPDQSFLDLAFGYYLHLLLYTHAPKAEPTDRQTLLASAALDYMETHYTDVIRLEDIAAHIGKTPSYTSFLVRSTTGKTIMEHIRDIRIRQACKLLAYSDTPIEEIISSCGFISQSYFFKVFKSAIGTSPHRYRTSHLAKDTSYEGDEALLDIPHDTPAFTYIPAARKIIRWNTPREYLSQATKG